MSSGRCGSKLVAAACVLTVICGVHSTAAGASDGPPSVADQLGSQLRGLRGGSDEAIADARQADVTISRAERVLVQVNVEGPADVAAVALESEGMSVSATADEPIPVVEGWIPATDLAHFTKLPGVTAILPVIGGGSDAGAAMSQGVAAHRIPQATAAGAGTGAGVDVGVISDSIDQVGGGIADSQASGDLPAGAAVSVLKDDTTGVFDEGRAMAEIIYDGAPGLNRIAFASGTVSGPADKADSIDQLVADGVDIIADDIFWLTEPFFQDGVVAQAVDAANAAGVTYFASAGNRASQSYEATYSDSGGFHDFDPAGPVDTVQTIATVPNGGFMQVALNWDEPWGAATSNFNITLVQTNGSPLPCSAPSGGQDDNPVTGLPREIVTWSSNCAPGTIGVALKIQRVSGAASPLIKYIARRNGSAGSFSVSEYPTDSDTINPDAASARGAITVAAVSATDPGTNTPESYSSRGPKTRLFDKNGVRLAAPEIRIKPEVAAADAVATTVPAYLTFTGTSASVPSAASIAANLISTNPNASQKEIRTQMTASGNSIDCTLSALVPDPDCGSGFLLADSANTALDRTGPVVSPANAPPAPNGSNGWYVSGVDVAWNPTDPESPVESTPCPPVSDFTDGIESFSCEATSGGGTSSGSVEIKRDTVKPAVPKITGIKARKYKLKGKGKLPPLGKIKCKSSDATSGLASCRIKGYKRKPGKRTLTATATDKAGLKSVRKLKIRIVR